MPRLVPLVAALALAACVEGSGAVQIGSGPDAFRIAAPAGYCLAEGAISRARASDFAAFTPCATGSAPGVLTATVGPAGAAQPVEPRSLAAFLSSPEGRRALSRAKDPRSVTVHQVLAVDGAVLVRMTDRARPPAAIAPGESWRAVMAVDGRLVTLSASPARGSTLGREAGRRLIAAFVTAMRAANGGD